MNVVVQTLRIFIGGLFIFSGLVKANDPLGLAYKMEEFFELWLAFWLVPFSKNLSVLMNALEIVCGVALWLGWQTKWNLRILLAMILFFTGLTSYTYYTGFPKTCGCFGDCIPINSSVSFFKDVALLIGILVLVKYQHRIRPLGKKNIPGYATLTATVFAFGFEYHVLNHLPVVDCLPYHVGQNIPEARQQPPPPPGSTVMFVYEKGGKQVEFPADKFPDDFNADTYRFIRRYDTGEIPQPKIQGLILFGMDGNDTTDFVLNAERTFLIFSEDLGVGPDEWGKGWSNILEHSNKKTIPIVLITNKPAEWRPEWQSRYPNVRVVGCDRTPIRTAARVNPTAYALTKGTIVGKWALKNFPTIEDPITGNMPHSN